MSVETQNMLESTQKKGLALAEKWSRLPGKTISGYGSSGTVDFLQGIPEDDLYKRACMAQLYENTLHWLNSMEESTRTLAVGSFEKFVSILRAPLIA